ncbi:MAG: methyltransferase domain-containing protein [Algoriphagus sp.]|nr:methyltransferase domain-containing protein [Algoriphagus sp.]
MSTYLHGFIPEEQQRLIDQAGILGSLIYPRIDFSDCKNLLEIGSGVGAQTEVLLKLFPDLHITCVDYSESQLEMARKNLEQFSGRVSFICQDAKQLELTGKYDSVFICWALEHISEPIEVLKGMKNSLLPGSKIWITEVFNSSFYFFPKLPGLERYYEAYNKFQISLGGDPDVGAKLGNMLKVAGYTEIELSHGGFHLDQTNPGELIKIITYWKGLMKSGSNSMIQAGVISKKEVISMENDLDQIAKDENAVFFYQFVQAKAIL